MRKRPRLIGIATLCLWAVWLMIEAPGRTLLRALQRSMVEQRGLWAPMIPAGLFAVALTVAVVGLWQLRDWARKLFLALLTVFYVMLFADNIALWGPVVGTPLGAPGQGWVTIAVLEAAIGLGFGWWYLNRVAVREWFGAAPRVERDERVEKA
jgi:hypothetical protein